MREVVEDQQEIDMRWREKTLVTVRWRVAAEMCGIASEEIELLPESLNAMARKMVTDG